MALRQLMLNKKIEQRKGSLTELLTQEESLQTRETELETALEEAKTDEEVTLVEEKVTELEGEKTELNEQKSKLETEIADLEAELSELNSKDPKKEERKENKITDNRGEGISMNRQRFYGNMTREAAEALVARDEVKEFLTRARDLKNQNRAVTNAELLIPDILIGLLRDNLHRYSKLIKRVTLRPVPGTARQNIMGAIPEAVWTEACAKLNELVISFSQIEVDGYKVGGFVAVCNATLEDSDINLLNEIMDAISQSIGYAVDKAILYGTGTKMPVGIVTRLAQTTQPSYWGAKYPTWTDLHTSNIKKFAVSSLTAEQFYSALILALGVVKANYSTGDKFWAMNSKTFAALQAKALVINAAGAIVSGQTQTMPIVGGAIEILEFIPDNDIIGGYGSLYLLAERAGINLAQSEHVQFIEDNTVFKGTARYDGQPIFGEGFVIANINNQDPTTTITFASDNANF